MRLLFQAGMIVTVGTGVALVFVHGPRWLLQHCRLTTEGKLVAAFALTGLIAPAIFSIKYVLNGTEFLSESLYVWPASLGLMALDRHSSTGEIVVGFSVAAVSNIGLYALGGLGLAKIWKWANRTTED